MGVFLLAACSAGTQFSIITKTARRYAGAQGTLYLLYDLCQSALSTFKNNALRTHRMPGLFYFHKQNTTR